MEILFGIGGGVLALIHNLFSVTVVNLRTDLAGGATPLLFFMAPPKSGENPLNLTKSKRSRIGFKAG
ncbi:MAG: hypothetical protein AB9917_19795 [Negativicutes bacterium]